MIPPPKRDAAPRRAGPGHAHRGVSASVPERCRVPCVYGNPPPSITPPTAGGGPSMAVRPRFAGPIAEIACQQQNPALRAVVAGSLSTGAAWAKGTGASRPPRAPPGGTTIAAPHRAGSGRIAAVSRAPPGWTLTGPEGPIEARGHGAARTGERESSDGRRRRLKRRGGEQEIWCRATPARSVAGPGGRASWIGDTALPAAGLSVGLRLTLPLGSHGRPSFAGQRHMRSRNGEL